MEDAMAMLTKSGKTPEELYKALCEQRVDLVFTAHPTQAMRGSVRKKYVNLFQDLRKLLHKMPNVEHHEIMEDMYANVQVTPLTTQFFNPSKPKKSAVLSLSANCNASLWYLFVTSTCPCCFRVSHSHSEPQRASSCWLVPLYNKPVLLAFQSSESVTCILLAAMLLYIVCLYLARTLSMQPR